MKQIMKQPFEQKYEAMREQTTKRHILSNDQSSPSFIPF
jgi:hypothetical protein